MVSTTRSCMLTNILTARCETEEVYRSRISLHSTQDDDGDRGWLFVYIFSSVRFGSTHNAASSTQW
jgi:hypothetical protein